MKLGKSKNKYSMGSPGKRTFGSSRASGLMGSRPKRKLFRGGFLSNQNQTLLGVILVAVLVCKYYLACMELMLPSKLMMLGSLVLAGIIMLNNLRKYEIQHYIVFAIFVAQFLVSRNITMVYAYIICLGLINIRFRTIVKSLLTFSVVMFAVMMVLNILNIMPSTFIHGRNDFGFGNPNAAFLSMFLIWIYFAYLVLNNMDRTDVFILVIMGIIMFNQTGTRTGLITIVASGIIMYIFRSRRLYDNPVIKWLSILSPAILTALNLLITYVLYGSLLLNKILSHRPLYWNRYFTDPKFGLNLTGYTANIKLEQFTPNVPFDSGYLWALYTHGIVVYAIFAVLMCLAIYYLYNEGKRAEIVLMLSIIVYAFAESILIDITNNITLVFMVYALSNLRRRHSL